MKKLFVLLTITAALIISCSRNKTIEETIPTNQELIDIGVTLINAYSTLVNIGNETNNVKPNNLEEVLRHYERKYSYFKRNDSISSGKGVRCKAMTADSISFTYWAYHVKDTIQFSIVIQAPLFIGKSEPIALLDTLINKSSNLGLIGTYRDLYEFPDFTYYIKGNKSHPLYERFWGTGCMITAFYNDNMEKAYNELRAYCKQYNRMQ